MKTKLTMIAIGYKGQNHTVFARLPVGEDGKVRMPYTYGELFNIPRGHTICIGGYPR